VTLRDLALADADGLEAPAGETDVAFEMDEAAFRAFYDRTARPLWAYLARMTGEPQAADDLLQESYYRLLRVDLRWEGEAHRRAYLFRIATNLVRDRQRRARRGEPVALPDGECDLPAAPGSDVAQVLDRRADVHRAMARLTPRERRCSGWPTRTGTPTPRSPGCWA
jgi:RNA polymerase sigma-70 factor, ECF subfamily